MTDDIPVLKMIREFVAVGRASFERPHMPEGDPDAQRRIVQGMEVLDERGASVDVGGALVDLLAPRAPFFDGCVLDAITAGVTQVVNLGAGYDDRAIRFAQTGVLFYEVDLPHVIADKALRLDALGARRLPILIPADLDVADIGTLLVTAGLDTSSPTLFLCEHILLFLGGSRVRRLLADLSRLAAPASRLALSVETHPDGIDSDLVIATVDEAMFAQSGLLRSIRSRGDWTADLNGSGWTTDTATRDVVVNHFDVVVDGQMIPIQTRFLKTAAR